MAHIGDEGTFLTSVDGINWRKTVYDLFWRPEKIVWSGSQYVVGRNCLISTSPDGMKWTKRKYNFR
jgi:hypothetical protein